ncbi:hypothetical protein EV702DRAFT_1080607 [Suillus placidus]|uniref:Secreted protein n=1 Tax=Suillus placidus TaxID=48579 RepID=A0A9P7D6U8_9AGAM|nr:hypothetical protein EV702DRAFT_1080607 [Suillus placidus]
MATSFAYRGPLTVVTVITLLFDVGRATRTNHVAVRADGLMFPVTEDHPTEVKGGSGEVGQRSREAGALRHRFSASISVSTTS